MPSWLTDILKRPPNAADAMKRFLILKFEFVKAVLAPPSDVIAELEPQQRTALVDATSAKFAELVHRLQANRLWEEMSNRERYFIQSSIDQFTTQDRIEASWLAESIASLLWALNLLHQLPRYDEDVSHDIVQKSPSEEPLRLINTARLRPFVYIKKQRDWAE